MPGPLPELRVTTRRTLRVAALDGEPGFVSAASGLAVIDGHFVVAADDAHHIGVFACDSDADGRLIRVLDGHLPEDPTERKRAKPDFEALTVLPAAAAHPSGALLVVGSGSTEQRITAVLIELDGHGRLTERVHRRDLTALFDPMREHSADLNVEGALVIDDELVLLSRANGASPDNHIARYPLDTLTGWLDGSSVAAVAPRSITAWRIGEIDGVPLGVTDAAVHPAGGWVFSAAAEDTQDSYNDGALAGAAVGVVDGRGEVAYLAALAPAAKVEGIVASVVGGRTVLSMVTDADDPTSAAELLVATLPG